MSTAGMSAVCTILGAEDGVGLVLVGAGAAVATLTAAAETTGRGGAAATTGAGVVALGATPVVGLLVVNAVGRLEKPKPEKIDRPIESTELGTGKPKTVTLRPRLLIVLAALKGEYCDCTGARYGAAGVAP